jgi:hypothetical protein
MGFNECSSLDPDYEPVSTQLIGVDPMDESFHNYLDRSRQVLVDAGYQTTMDVEEMNVFVSTLSSTGPPLPPSEYPFDPLILVIGVPVLLTLIVVATVVIRRRN